MYRYNDLASFQSIIELVKRVMKTYILLIEDNQDIRESMAEILDLEGYEVITADCGQAGLNLAGKHIPDLIICDIVMSDLDGYSVYKALQKHSETRHIPVIFSTAKSEKSDRNKASSLGVEDYLIKPFNDIDLIKCVRKCLK